MEVDTRYSCPFCRAETLTASSGRTGLHKALALLQKAAERVPDHQKDLARRISLLAGEVETLISVPEEE